MTDWTPEGVEDRLIEAASVLKRLPAERINGYYSLWPKAIYEFADLVGQEPRPMRRPPPQAAAISRMEQSLTWIRFLEVEDGKLVWARAAGARWKAICWRFGIAPATAKRRWTYALSLITWKLNGRRVGTKTSRRAFMERVRVLSR